MSDENQNQAKTSDVKPGWKTSEAWFTFMVIVLAGLLSSGVIGEMTPTGKWIVFALGVAKALGYTASRTAIKNAAMIALVMMFVHSQAACVHDSRARSIQATLTSLNAASLALAAYDASHQNRIASTAPDRETAEKQLSEWRQTRTTIALVFESAYRATALAAIGNDDLTIQAMINAAAVVIQELSSLGIKVSL